MDHNVSAAQRLHDDQEAAADGACQAAAAAVGVTSDQADACNDGDQGCPSCPWKRDQAITELERFILSDARRTAEEAGRKEDPRFISGTGFPPVVQRFVAYSAQLAGWCVFVSRSGGLVSLQDAGPFSTREEAEALLGPALAQLPARDA